MLSSTTRMTCERSPSARRPCMSYASLDALRRDRHGSHAKSALPWRMRARVCVCVCVCVQNCVLYVGEEMRPRWFAVLSRPRAAV